MGGGWLSLGPGAPGLGEGKPELGWVQYLHTATTTSCLCCGGALSPAEPPSFTVTAFLVTQPEEVWVGAGSHKKESASLGLVSELGRHGAHCACPALSTWGWGCASPATPGLAQAPLGSRLGSHQPRAPYAAATHRCPPSWTDRLCSALSGSPRNS